MIIFDAIIIFLLVMLIAVINILVVLYVGDGKNQFITLAIIGISLIVSLYCFQNIDEEFSINFFKYPQKTLPMFFLLVCFMSTFAFIFFVLLELNQDFLVFFGILFSILLMAMITFSIMGGASLVFNISDEIIKNREVKMNENYNILENKKENKSYFLSVEIKESDCYYFVLNLKSMSNDKNKIITNKEGNKYLIGNNIYLNNKKYDEYNKKCKNGNNIVNFEMIEQ